MGGRDGEGEGDTGREGRETGSLWSWKEKPNKGLRGERGRKRLRRKGGDGELV